MNELYGFDIGYPVGYASVFSPYTACRVGEAKNPGPFTVAALNIQSLHCALDESKLEWDANDVLALSETCATQFVLDKAQKTAAAHGRHAYSSAPVKRRHFKRGTISEIRGESSGVWMASKVHCRGIDLPWPDDIATTCRSCDAILYTPNGLVYMACLYVYHQGFQDASPKTDRILEAIFERSRLLRLPAIVVGDFNADLESLPVWTCMCERGWADAALAHQQQTGHAPAPTYKEVSRIDFIIMNDLAKRSFIGYEASELPVSDHRMISASFDWQKCQGLMTMYRMPRDMSQLGLDGQLFADARVPIAMQVQFDRAMIAGSIDDVWTSFTASMEQVASNVVSLQNKGSIPKKFLGKDKCKFVKTHNTAPVIKKGRDDAFQAEVQDCGIKLRQRIKQIRRIDAFLSQHKAAGPVTEQRRLSMLSTWNALLTAPGFGRSFASWFTTEFDAPCPLDPPDENMAKRMRMLMVEKVPLWRSQYNRTRIRQTKEAFEKDWSKGGKLFHRALQPPNSPPVDAIDRADELHVRLTRARKKGTAVFLTMHEDLQLVTIGQRWVQGATVGVVSDVIGGRVLLKVVSGTFRSGAVTAMTTCQCSNHALRLATDFWKSFWCKQQCVDCHDQDVLATIHALPHLPALDCKITMPELRAALRNLPLAKARGMDAVTNWELKYLCDDLQGMLLRVLNRITELGQWPKALTKARMHLIRKTQEAGDINSTRPICILPNVYRLWGKIMTSKCFRHFKGSIPATIFGSVPGRSSIDLAMQLQAEIEEHIISGSPIYGASLDLHKAFNTLSRPLLARMCARLGLGDVWMPYSALLQNLQRFFTIKGQWSNPVLSNTGVPEGCPLSVVMMMITTWAITAQLGSEFPGKAMSSYVDDWTIRDVDPARLVSQLQYVQKLTQKVGMSLSIKKTLPYATTAPARKKLAQALRACNLPCDVADTGNCLGIQFQARNAKVTDLREKRMNNTLPKMRKLKVMPWSHTKKASLLQSGIYPAMLYGCEFHDMGLHFISHIRSQANGTVWKDKPYLSHFLTPILSTKPEYEPWLWILRRVYLSFRRLHCMHPEQTLTWWNNAIPRPANKHTVGPITVLLAHLRRLGWTLGQNFACTAKDGTEFSLIRISCWQFKRLIVQAWQDWLVPKLKIKHGLHDLQSFDIHASCWQCPDAKREGFMATVRSGGLFTNKVKSRMFSQASPDCSLCGAADGMSHRIYDCPASEKIRERQGCQFLKEAPRSRMVYGLFPRPEAEPELQRLLDELRIHDLQMVPESEEPTYIFTDGSCSQPPLPNKSERRASYGVRLAVLNSHEGKVLAQGVLPGRKQTAFRAELFAFMMAMSCSMHSVIHTDCLGVYKGIVKLQREGWCELSWLASPDLDLWQCAWQILSVPGRKLQPEWTPAHKDITHAKSASQAWKIYHNALTDKCASVQSNPLPEWIQPCWERLHEQNRQQQILRDAVATYLQEIWASHSEADRVNQAAADARAVEG